MGGDVAFAAAFSSFNFCNRNSAPPADKRAVKAYTLWRRGEPRYLAHFKWGWHWVFYKTAF